MEHLKELSRSRRQSRVVFWFLSQTVFVAFAFALMLLVPELRTFAMYALCTTLLVLCSLGGIIYYDRRFDALATSQKVRGERALQLMCSLFFIYMMVVVTLTALARIWVGNNSDIISHGRPPRARPCGTVTKVRMTNTGQPVTS